MEVREQGAKERRYALHVGEELFVIIGTAKHGYDALNMHNVFRMSRKKDSGEELRTSHSVHQFTVAPTTPSVGASFTGHSKVAVHSLKSPASGLTPAKRDANSSHREATH